MAGSVDLQRVIPMILPHSLIKRSQLLEALEVARSIQPMSERAPAWGSLARAGAVELCRLYWDELLSFRQIAARFGVTDSAVKLFMRRNGIPTRSRAEGIRLAATNRDPVTEVSRRAKISEAKLRQWQDPAYRKRQQAAMRAGWAAKRQG